MKKSRKEKTKKLYDEFGYLVHIKSTKEIPEEHRASSGGLKCFRKVYQRENGNVLKDLPKRRCKRSCVKGSLFCSRHGGGNSNAVTTAQHRNKELSMIQGRVSTDLGNMLQQFLEQDNITSLNFELASLKSILIMKLEKLSNNRPKNLKKMINEIEAICQDNYSEPDEKFDQIKSLVDSYESLTDSSAIKIIESIVETIGKTVDRIHKFNMNEKYMLTQEGMRVMLKSIVDTFEEVVEDPVVRKAFKERLIKVRTEKNEPIRINAEVDNG